MARLNLTIPDPLYERLERWRDRVNVSRVCATALEKELAMLEAVATSPLEPKIERLLERLQSHQERWFQRGHQDGETWAVEEASSDELRLMGEEWEDDGEYDLEEEIWESVEAEEKIKRWILSDLEQSNVGPHCRVNSEAYDSARQEVDEWAYMNGWHYAVRDIWKVAGPLLRRSRRPD